MDDRAEYCAFFWGVGICLTLFVAGLAASEESDEMETTPAETIAEASARIVDILDDRPTLAIHYSTRGGPPWRASVVPSSREELGSTEMGVVIEARADSLDAALRALVARVDAHARALAAAGVAHLPSATRAQHRQAEGRWRP